MEHAVEVRGLSKHYQRFALQNLAFHVPRGEITGFIGRNGAGKTTTIRVLLGLNSYDSGDISFFGTGMDASDTAIRARLGVVLDGGTFFDDLTMKQMKSMLAPAYPTWSDDAFWHYMEVFLLDPRQKISTLSRGMRAKFAVALALSHDAEFLIMDEPTSGLDPIIRRELLDVLKDVMRDDARSVLFSTHITSDLERVADEIIMIDEGQILFQENKDELLETWQRVRGTAAMLTPTVRSLVYDLKETPFGFTGTTCNAPILRHVAPGVLTERPSIEDVIAAAIDKRDINDASILKGANYGAAAYM